MELKIKSLELEAIWATSLKYGREPDRCQAQFMGTILNPNPNYSSTHLAAVNLTSQREESALGLLVLLTEHPPVVYLYSFLHVCLIFASNLLFYGFISIYFRVCCGRI